MGKIGLGLGFASNEKVKCFYTIARPLNKFYLKKLIDEPWPGIYNEKMTSAYAQAI